MTNVLDPVSPDAMISPSDVQAQATEAARAAAAFVEANKIAVVDLDSLRRAVTVRQDILAAQQGIADKLGKPKAWAFGLHRWFCQLEKAALAPYVALDAYEQEQIAKFKAEQDRAREQRERDEQEQRRRDDEARAAHEAAQLETAGEPEMAAAVIETALAAPPPVVALPDLTKQVDGLKFRRTWKWKYTGGPADIKQTPPHVIARSMKVIPREFLTVDERKLNGLRTMQGSQVVPGIDFYYVDEPIR